MRLSGTNMGRLVLWLSLAFWAVGSLAATNEPPVDPKLKAAYSRLNFDLQYPPEAVQFLQETLQPLPQAVTRLNELAADERAEVRILVANLLAELGDPSGAQGLWKLLADKSEPVRVSAAGGFQRLHELAKVPLPVELAVLNDERSQVRQMAVAAVRLSGAPKMEGHIIPMLKDPDAFVRMEAATTLMAIGTKTAVPGLVEALRDKNVLVRTAATKALGVVGGLEAVPALTMAMDDSDWHVRAKAIIALAAHTRHPVEGARINELVVSKLRLDDFALVRDRAADALRSTRDEKAVAALVQAVVSDDCDVRFHAARTICNAELTAALPLLMAHTYHEEAQVREKVIEIFGAIGGQAELPFVADATGDPDLGVRLAAVKSLRQLHARGGGGVLRSRLQDPNPHVRAATARLLGDLGDKSNCEALLPLLKDDNGYVRSSAAEALGRLGDRSAVKPLLAMLTGEALGDARTGDGVTIGLTNSFLNSIAALSGPEQKMNTIQVLGELRATEAVDPIAEHGLKDADPLVRATAAVALGKIQSPRAVGPLQDAVKQHYELLALMPEDNAPVINVGEMIPDAKRIDAEKENRVRASVAWALGQIADPAAEEILLKAANDRNSLVRDAAQEALARIQERRDSQAAREAAAKTKR